MMGFTGGKQAGLSSASGPEWGDSGGLAALRSRVPRAGLRQLREMGRGLLHLAWPPQCLACKALVAEEGGLCPACWREAGFIAGLACDSCGVALPGRRIAGRAAASSRYSSGQERAGPGLSATGPEMETREAAGTGFGTLSGAEPEAEYCDACMAAPRPWQRGRAVLSYEGAGRRIALGLKHERFDLFGPVGRWLARAASDLLRPDSVVAPVPLHWSRLLQRRYNQAALLAGALAREVGMPHCPDLLLRRRATGSQEDRNRAERLVALEGAFCAHPRRLSWIEGRHVLLVDDVMTTGATLTACTDACYKAGADAVDVVVLARTEAKGAKRLGDEGG